jgi:hypothetical protein
MHPSTGSEALYRPYGPWRSRGSALLFHYHGTRRGLGDSVTSRPLFITGKDPVHIVQEAGWDPGPVWIDAEILASTGIRSPNRPARGQSLYRPRYPATKSENIFPFFGFVTTYYKLLVLYISMMLHFSTFPKEKLCLYMEPDHDTTCNP